jgi:uncharacterized protein YxeA
MKRIFLILITLSLVTILFSGCDGIITSINQNNEDYSQFLSLVDSLDTPKKIEKWLQDNTEWESDDVKCTAYKFYLIRKGDCAEYAYFINYVLHHHDYESYFVGINNKDSPVGHALTVFKNKNYQIHQYNFFSNFYLHDGETYEPLNFVLNSIEACVEKYVESYNFWEPGSYLIEGYDVYPWNYFG